MWNRKLIFNYKIQYGRQFLKEILQNVLTKKNNYIIAPRKFIIVSTLFHIGRVLYAGKRNGKSVNLSFDTNTEILIQK